MAFVCGSLLVVLHTYWRKTDELFDFPTLQHAAEYLHSCGLVYVLVLAGLAFFRGRAIQAHRRLYYPYIVSFAANIAILCTTLWVFARGVNARVLVVQDYHLVAVIFASCVAMLLFDLLAICSRVPTIGFANGAASVIVGILHIAAVVLLVLATVNLEYEKLNISTGSKTQPILG